MIRCKKIPVSSVVASLALVLCSCQKQDEAVGPDPKPEEAESVIGEEPAIQNGSPGIAMEGAVEVPPAQADSADPSSDSPQPEILKDLSSIQVEPGSPSPVVGDPIYTMATLPSGKCGEYWVKESDGTVSKVAVCTGDHEGGH